MHCTVRSCIGLSGIWSNSRWQQQKHCLHGRPPRRRRHGLLCWAKQAGMVPCGQPVTASITVPWDAVWWWTRPDGILQIQPASRSTTNPGLLVPDQIRTPLWAASSDFLDSRLPRTEEANGSEGWHPFISMVGAAWLLMAQPNITETRTTESTDVAPRRGDSSTGRSARRETSVVIIELRRDLAQSRRSPVHRVANTEAGGWWDGRTATGDSSVMDPAAAQESQF